ncbi:Uncharacterised protein [Mycobacteroides abscessus subsp. abscessus]|nr:Uncharacterised protein [Mycobacteroides abscessus subsp. abscessus]
MAALYSSGNSTGASSRTTVSVRLIRVGESSLPSRTALS